VNIQYSKRMQPALEYAGSDGTYFYQRCYDFHQLGGLNMTYGGVTCSSTTTSPGNNGNLYQVVNKLDDNRTQNYTYDPLNRIGTAYTNGPNWGQSFVIDPWSNLTNVNNISGKTQPGGLSAAPASTKNQLNGYVYDPAGNLSNDGLGHAFMYDAENRIATVAGVTYTYDGDGKRVEKSSGTLYWNGVGSDAISESDLSGNITAEYIFFSGTRVARVDRPSLVVHHFLRDHLSSSRMSWIGTTDANRVVEQDVDYTPYGIIVGAAPVDPFEFTGKEYDSESGAEYFDARHYTSTMGRFVQPDPGWIMAVNAANPQSLNMYSYALNNPLKFIDPSGMILCDYGPSDNGGEDFEDADDEKECNNNEGTPAKDQTTITVSADGSSPQCTGDCGTPTILSRICSALPSGSVQGVSGAVGFLGAPTGALDLVTNYRSGQVSEFAAGGLQLAGITVASLRPDTSASSQG
jgi:RHS repeat-associated protein